MTFVLSFDLYLGLRDQTQVVMYLKKVPYQQRTILFNGTEAGGACV